MSEFFLAQAQVLVTPNTKGFRAALLAELKDATKKPVSVKVVPNVAGFAQLLRGELAALKIPPVKVAVVPILTGFGKALEAEIAAATKGGIPVPVAAAPITAAATTAAPAAAAKATTKKGAPGQAAREEVTAEARIRAESLAEWKAFEAERTAASNAAAAERLAFFKRSEAEQAAVARSALTAGKDQAKAFFADEVAQAKAAENAAKKTAKAQTAAAKEQEKASVAAAAAAKKQTAEAERAARAQERSAARSARAAERAAAATARGESGLTGRIGGVRQNLAIAEQAAASAATDVAAAQVRLTAARTADKTATNILTAANNTGNATLIAQAEALKADTAALRVNTEEKLRNERAEARRASVQAGATKGVGTQAASLVGLRGATLAASGSFIVGAASAIAFVKAVKSAADLESELNVFRVTAGATASEMQRVSSEAQKLGRDITLPGVSAGDAAEAMTELAKAGLTVQDSIAGARGVLQLATAAGIDNAQATVLAASALNAFGLSGDQAVHVADLLTNAANLAQGSIEDIGLSLQQAAAVSRQVGVSLEDTVALLTLLARNGIRGSDAGTSLRVAFTKLINPTVKARGVLSDLNVQLRDFEGNIRPEVFSEFAQAQKGLSKAQQDQNAATVFGTDALRAYSIISREGADSLNATRDALDRQGSAAELAGARMTGLSGKLENLKNQFQALGLTFGTILLPPLELVVDIVATTIGEFNDLAQAGVSAAKKIANAFKDIGDDDSFLPFGLDDDAKGLAGKVKDAIPKALVLPSLFIDDSKEDPAKRLEATRKEVSSILDEMKKAKFKDLGIQEAATAFDKLIAKLKSGDAESQKLAGTVQGVRDQLVSASKVPPFKLPQVKLPRSLLTDNQKLAAEINKTAAAQKKLFVVGKPKGLLEPGNLDLLTRKVANLGNGVKATVRSISKEFDGKEILIPTVIDGKALEGSAKEIEAQAVAHFKKTGENLGTFTSVAYANAYAQTLHEQQANLINSTHDVLTNALEQALPGHEIFTISFEAFDNLKVGITQAFQAAALAVQSGGALLRSQTKLAIAGVEGQIAGFGEAFDRAVASDSRGGQLSVLKSRAAADRAIITKAGPDAKGDILKARRAAVKDLASTNEQIRSINAQAKSEREQAVRDAESDKKDAQDKRDKADQAFLDSLGVRSSKLDTQELSAQLNGNLKKQLALAKTRKRFILDEIALIQEHVSDQKVAATQIQALRDEALQQDAKITGLVDEIFASDSTKAQERVAFVEAGGDQTAIIKALLGVVKVAREQVNRAKAIGKGVIAARTAFREAVNAVLDARSARFDARLAFAQASGASAAAINRIFDARIAELNTAIAKAKLEGRATGELRAALQDVENQKREATDSLLEKRTQLAELRGDKSAIIKALDAQIAQKRKEIAAAKKLGKATIDLQIELETFLNKRDEINGDLDKSKGTTAFDIFKQSSDVFKEFASNVAGSRAGTMDPTAGAIRDVLAVPQISDRLITAQRKSKEDDPVSILKSILSELRLDNKKTKSVTVEQHFKEATPDRHREARLAAFAARASFDG